MTPTDAHRDRSRSYASPQGAPIPQPVFVNQPDVSRFLSPTGWDDPLEYADFVPAAPDVRHDNMQPGPSHPAPLPHAGDVFSAVGLGGPTGYSAPVQNAQAGPSHDPRSMHVDASMHAPSHPPGFINLRDDNPLAQMPHMSNPPLHPS